MPQHRRQAGLVLDRAQRGAVEQLHRRHGQGLERQHGGAGAGDVGEKNQRAGLVPVFRHGVVGDAGNETERAFRAYHQMAQDVDRIVKVDQRVQAVSGRVLDLVLAPDQRRQCQVRARFPAQLRQCRQQCAVTALKGGDAEWVGAVEEGAIGQHHAHRAQGAVTVLRGAAAHARGIVGGDAADLAGGDRGRIGADLAAQRRQAAIHFGAYHARPQSHAQRAVVLRIGGEAVAQQHQHAVGHGLPGQAGAGGAEGQVHLMLARHLQHMRHVGLVFHHHDHLGQHAVETGIAAPAQAAQFIGDDARVRQACAQRRDQGRVRGGGCGV